MPRSPAIFHCTSEPYRFFGRTQELTLLDAALAGGDLSLVGFVGPGGQGKTAIVRHWLEKARERLDEVDGLFFWSFYRGKDSDLCLRELFAYAEGMDQAPEASASFCVDRLLPRLRAERWAIVLDGTEVVQHEEGSWRGRFIHPELGRLLEDLAIAPMPGLAVLTTRFELPTLQARRHARLLTLSTLDLESACLLARSLGMHGSKEEIEEAAHSCGLHAKAVELLGTYLTRYHQGEANRHRSLPEIDDLQASDEERQVARVLAGFQSALTSEEKDILALATAFRQPPRAGQFQDYLKSTPVRHLLHDVWNRRYVPIQDKPAGWMEGQIQTLVDLRLLERVSLGPGEEKVLDAHPLVRRGFENTLGGEGRRHGATSRAGFLRGRPDRRAPASLEEAREEVELFHAYREAGLWNEADGVYVALDNPKHRFLAPAFERDLLLGFFPERDWRRRPLWPGFGRYRSLAICLEMLGQFEEAIHVYSPADRGLRGDALLAMGKFEPVLTEERVPNPWQDLWQTYRVHALALAGRTEEAVRLAGRLTFAVDVYEWVHLFEGLLRCGRLDVLDGTPLRTRRAEIEPHAWGRLAMRRIQADYRRVREGDLSLEGEYRELMEAYDRAGLPWERGLARLSLGRLLQAQGDEAGKKGMARAALDLARQYGMSVVEVDALEMLAEEPGNEERIRAFRTALGYCGMARP